MMMSVGRFAWAGAACFAIVASLTVHAQQSDKHPEDSKEDDAQRPKLVLKARPMVGISPTRVVLTAQLVGGAKDYEEYYCPVGRMGVG